MAADSDRKYNGKMFPDHDPGLGHPSELPDTRGSSKDMKEGVLKNIAGNLDSGADKEDNQCIKKLSEATRIPREVVSTIQTWQKGEEVPASVGLDGAKAAKPKLISPDLSSSVLAGLISEAYSYHQVKSATSPAALEARNEDTPKTSTFRSFRIKGPSRSRINPELITSPLLASPEEAPRQINPRRQPPVERKKKPYVPQQPTITDTVSFSQNYMLLHKPPRIVFEGQLKRTLTDVAAMNERYKDSICYTWSWLRPNIWVEVCNRRSKLFGLICVTCRRKGDSYVVKFGTDTFDVPIWDLRSHVPPIGDKVVILRGSYLNREATIITKNDTEFVAEVIIRKKPSDPYSRRRLSLGYGYIAAISM